MDKLEPPQHFLFEGNVSHIWKLWLKKFRLCFTTTEKDNKNHKIKTSMLVTCISQEDREIYEKSTFNSADDEMKLESVLNKFSECRSPTENLTILRHKFVTYKQLEGRSFHDFIIELKKLNSECEFKNFWDSLIKDMIVCCTNDNAFLERLLRESDLTLSRATSAKKTRKQAHEISQSQSTADLHKFNKLSDPHR